MITAANGISFVAAPAIGMLLYAVDPHLPFAASALSVGFCSWSSAGAGSTRPPSCPAFPRRARTKHSGKDEADAADRPHRVALQRVLDPGIFVEHLLGHRRAGFGQRGFEIGHRHRACVEPAAKRGQPGAADEIFEVGAGEALGPLGERFRGRRPWPAACLRCGSQGSAAVRRCRACRHRSARRSGRAAAAPGRSGSGRLVAPITTTLLSSSSPSISARMVLTTRSVTCGSPMPPPRAGTRLSSSSMKMTVGATWRARANSRAICCSLSPYHLDKQVGRLGGDEIGLAFARGRLGQHGLAGPGRAVEQEAPGRPDAEPAERFGMLQRQLDAFAQLVARRVEPADIVPADVAAPGPSLRASPTAGRASAHCRSPIAVDRQARRALRSGCVSSARLILGMIRRTASSAASRVSAARSAPTKP